MIGLTSKAACAAVIIYYWWRLWVREGTCSRIVPTHSSRDFTAPALEKISLTPPRLPSLIFFTVCPTQKNLLVVWSEVVKQKAALPAFDSGCVDATLCLQTVVGSHSAKS